VDLEQLVRLQNRFMIGFDLVLGSATLVAPRSTLRLLGHDEPSAEVIAGFRRLSWVWLTFSAAHMRTPSATTGPRMVGARMAARDGDPGRPDLVVLPRLAPPGQPPVTVVLGGGEHGDDGRISHGWPTRQPAKRRLLSRR